MVQDTTLGFYQAVFQVVEDFLGFVEEAQACEKTDPISQLKCEITKAKTESFFASGRTLINASLDRRNAYERALDFYRGGSVTSLIEAIQIQRSSISALNLSQKISQSLLNHCQHYRGLYEENSYQDLKDTSLAYNNHLHCEVLAESKQNSFDHLSKAKQSLTFFLKLARENSENYPALQDFLVSPSKLRLSPKNKSKLRERLASYTKSIRHPNQETLAVNLENPKKISG
ncbi:MAG: hypothetical protein KDK66_07535 [Deltaproteobacteria bacterium]|nr:hypothetical protein [Deltaproteobacteria bacterium]